MLSLDRATRRAKALLRKMRGQGWQLRVWKIGDDSGYRYAVFNGPLWVMARDRAEKHGRDEYCCLLDDRDRGCCTGEVYWIVNKYFLDPNAAVDAQVDKALRFMRDRDIMLTALRQRLAGFSPELALAQAKVSTGRPRTPREQVLLEQFLKQQEAMVKG